MSKTFTQFFTSKRIVAKGLVIMTLFVTIASGVSGPALMAGIPAVAQAQTTTSPSGTSTSSGNQTCSVATAMADIASSTTPRVGDIVTYTLVGAPAITTPTTMTVTDVLGAGLTFVSASASVGSYSSADGIWNVGLLNSTPLTGIKLVIEAKVNPGTEGQTINNVPSIEYVQNNCTQTVAVTNALITVQAAVITPTSTPEYADMAISKTADVTSTMEGDTVNYTVKATDFGPATSTDVVATDLLPTGLTFVSATTSEGSYASSNGIWTIGTLDASANATLTIAAKVNAGTAGTSITNKATITESTSTIDSNLANNSSSVTIAVQKPIVVASSSADIAISKTADVTSTMEGNVIHYRLNVTDNGPATSTGVVATDVLPSGLTFENAIPSIGTYSSATGIWTIGTVAPGSIATLDIAALVKSGTANTTITNTAIVRESSSEVDPNVANNSSSVSVFVNKNPVIIPSADISIVKTANVTSTKEGATVYYTIKVTDNGPATSTAVVAIDTLPSGLTFEGVAGSVGTYSTSTGVWTIGTLKTNSTATLTIAARVNVGTAGTSITNVATVTESASTTDPDLSNNRSLVTIFVQSNGGGVCTVSGALANTVSDIHPQVGETITYTLIGGFAPTASTTITVQDVLAQGLTFVSADPSVGTYATSTGIWTLGTFNHTISSTTLNIVATVNSGTEGKIINNTPSIHYVGNSCTESSAINPISITVQKAVINPTSTPAVADIAISKTADVSSTTEGSTVHYTLLVTDLGPATSTDVVASDTLPSGVTFVSATSSEGSYASSTGIWTIGDMSASSTATLTIAALVDSGTAGTTITNTGFVTESASTTDPNLSNNSSSVSIAVQSNGGGGASMADIAISKTADVTSTAEGATIHYTLTVSDHGPSASTDVVATDVLPSGLTFENASASVGSYSTSTGKWTIGTVDTVSTPTLVITALVNSGTAGTTITNTAAVAESLSETDPNPGNNISSVSIPVAQNGGGGAVTADIAINKTVNNATPKVGDEITFTVVVTDHGPDTSSIVTAHDALPIGLATVSATTSQGSYNIGNGNWVIGTVTPSSTATLTVVATVMGGEAGKTIVNTATVSQLNSIIDPNLANNSSSVTLTVQTPGIPLADISITKTVDNANPSVGDTVHYLLTAAALGPAISTGVVASDTLPSGVTFVSATSSEGSYASSTGIWTIGDMSASSTATLTIAALVDSGTAGTTITNTGFVTESASTTDPNLSNNSSSVSIAVQSNGGGGGGGCTVNCGGGGNTPSAEIGIVKTVDNATPATGATIHYTLTVSATGPSASLGVVANDVLPSGLTFVSATSSEGSYASSTGIWTIGQIAEGHTATLTITATVTASAGTQITNVGTVKESPTVIDPLSGNNSSSVTITVAGGGGNGGGGGGNGGGGNGGGGGSRGGGQVLGASCGLYLTQYIHPVRQSLNDPVEVKKLQVFLNLNLGLNLPITGYYGPATIAAVNQFQVKYHIEVLRPWLPLGLPTEFTPTSYVYQTTQRWINLIMCPPLNIPLPALHVDTGGE